MVTDSDRVTGKTAVAMALAQGHTVAEAARTGGVSVRTVTRYREDPRFRGEVNRLRADILTRTVGALVEASTDAVTTLRLCLAADSEPVRVRAAVAILHALITVRDSVDHEQRLLALEEAQKDE